MQGLREFSFPWFVFVAPALWLVPHVALLVVGLGPVRRRRAGAGAAVVVAAVMMLVHDLVQLVVVPVLMRQLEPLEYMRSLLRLLAPTQPCGWAGARCDHSTVTLFARFRG